MNRSIQADLFGHLFGRPVRPFGLGLFGHQTCSATCSACSAGRSAG
jgi:hypothetical protein